jgi:hypothetical protein
MRLRLAVVILLAGCAFTNACNRITRSEPAYPQHVRGWQAYEQNGIKYLGEFVVERGKSTSNGKIRLEVIDILPPELRAETGTQEALARAIIRFVDVSTNATLCQDQFPERSGSRLDSICDGRLDRFGISSIGITDINVKDGWVHFALG